MTHISDLSLTRLDGSQLNYSEIDDKVVLIVNVASACGFTRQYTGLVELYEANKAKGLVVIGVPCNQFGQQEPGSAADIQAFCSTTYNVSFPLLEKQDVNGEARSPLYTYLVNSDLGGGLDIEWNFAKFLLDRDGEVVARFRPQDEPTDIAFLATIRAELA